MSGPHGPALPLPLSSMHGSSFPTWHRPPHHPSLTPGHLLFSAPPSHLVSTFPRSCEERLNLTYSFVFSYPVWFLSVMLLIFPTCTAQACGGPGCLGPETKWSMASNFVGFVALGSALILSEAVSLSVKWGWMEVVLYCIFYIQVWCTFPMDFHVPWMPLA